MKLLTLVRDLRRRKARERHGLFVCEGVRAVEELLRSPLRVRGALLGPAVVASDRGLALAAELRARGVETLQVDEREFASAADTESPQGILVVADVPRVTLDTLPLGATARIVVLDAVQDPGNVGTILRTAAALGADATVALPGTVDLWNAKVVRGAMGAHFHHPAPVATWDELDGFCARHDVALWAADAGGQPVDDGEPPARLALVMGNEGNGLEPRAVARADRLVALPISSAVESLNVAVATGILLYVLRPR
jgi:TrmH family RNA methyltransferase